jgi:hypothetical protein
MRTRFIHPIDIAAVSFAGGLYLAICIGLARMWLVLWGVPA